MKGETMMRLILNATKRLKVPHSIITRLEKRGTILGVVYGYQMSLHLSCWIKVNLLMLRLERLYMLQVLEISIRLK